MVKILHISANTNSYHKNYNRKHVAQQTTMGIEYKRIFLTDKNFPNRENALNPRLQAKMPRMLGFDMYPGYDYYFWSDSNITLNRSDAIMSFYNLCRDKEMVVFKHPHRSFLYEEFKFMSDNVGIPFLEKYKGEFIKEQYERYKSELKNFRGVPLYASGCFMYKNTEKTRMLMKEWYFQNCRYSTQCQLSLPYVVQKYNPAIVELTDNILDNDYLKYWGY